MNDHQAARELARILKAVRFWQRKIAAYEKGRTYAAMQEERSARDGVNALLERVEADPPESAQQELADYLERIELPDVPKPTPPEHHRRDLAAAKKEANKRYREVLAGVVAEGFSELEAKERAERVRRLYLTRAGF